MSSIADLTVEEAQAISDFYRTNFPDAEYFVVTGGGAVRKQDLASYMTAYGWALGFQDQHPDELLDVWVKVNREQNAIARATAV